MKIVLTTVQYIFWRCEGVEYFLVHLADSLPNTEFVLNVHDHPQMRSDDSPLPVFSFSKVISCFYKGMRPYHLKIPQLFDGTFGWVVKNLDGY